MHRKFFNNKKYYIAIFNSKNNTVRLFYILEKKGYNLFQLISAPCQLKAGCNYCIKFNDLEGYKILKKEATKYNSLINELYLVERKEGKKIITKIESSI